MEYRRVDFFLVLLISILIIPTYLSGRFSQMEDTSSIASARKLIVSALTLTTYHAWISEVKGIAERSRVWEHVDPDGSEPEPVVFTI